MRSEIKTAIIFGVIVVAVVGIINFGFSFIGQSTEFEREIDVAGNTVPLIDKSGYSKAPDLVGIADYINTTPEDLQVAISDKVVLYDIWTYSCINCIRTMPYVTTWYEKYADDGLLVIGVHSPEFEFEKDLENVKFAVQKYDIKYPVVLDNDHETWNAFENRYWPRKYLADSEGYIRYDHIGEGAYEKTEQVIQQLLEERAQLLGLNVASAEPLIDFEEFQHTSFRTPELYFGYKFAYGRDQLGNSEGFSPGKVVSYSIPNQLTQHYFYMDGKWQNLEDSMKLVSDKGKIVVPYFAKNVNIVTAEKADLNILIDDAPISDEFAGTDVENGVVRVIEPRLYNIVSTSSPETHTLTIEATSPGFEIFTFTFG